MSRFKIGDYVLKKGGHLVLTGRVTVLLDSKGRYTVKFDPTSNDTSILTDGLAYEDELVACDPPTTTKPN